MTLEILYFVLGMMTGSIVTLAIALPQVGRAIARVAGVTATAVGFGLLIWVFAAQARDGAMAAIALGRLRIAEPSDAFGWGAGLLLGGAIALLLSFLRGSASSVS